MDRSVGRRNPAGAGVVQGAAAFGRRRHGALREQRRRGQRSQSHHGGHEECRHVLGLEPRFTCADDGRVLIIDNCVVHGILLSVVNDSAQQGLSIGVAKVKRKSLPRQDEVS
jgi:hypothetical protein